MKIRRQRPYFLPCSNLQASSWTVVALLLLLASASILLMIRLESAAIRLEPAAIDSELLHSPQTRRDLGIELTRLNAENEKLRYQLEMLRIRCYPLPGPISLSSLPDGMRTEFYTDLYAVDPDRVVDGRGGAANIRQIPVQAVDLMERTGEGNWKRDWSKQLVDTLIRHAKRSGNLSPPDYPSSAFQIQKGLLDFVVNPIQFPTDPIKAKQIDKPKILVAGSVGPWVEATTLALLPNSLIHVVDYQTIRVDDDRINFVSMQHLKQEKPDPGFDVIISFSSLEHDGLGRYGDPLHPNGDLAAMAELWTWLQPQGLLFLAVPYTANSTLPRIEGNLHRVYGSERMSKMMTGFTMIERIDPGTKYLSRRFGQKWDSTFRVRAAQVGFQPLFVLRKNDKVKPYMLMEYR